MRVPLKWLQDYVDITLSPQELAKTLTLSGTEVAGLTTVGAAWENIFVGEIKALRPHPVGGNLWVATVQCHKGEFVSVTGAPNAALGARVALALPGALLYEGHSRQSVSFTVSPREVRGIVSEAVLCSEKELGLSEDHTGILILNSNAKVGTPLRDALGDIIFDLEITPNRPDCMCVLGVAREVAALTGQRARRPVVDLVEGTEESSKYATVEIADPDLCPRYTGMVITGVKVGSSPQWVQERLKASGMRPINNVVDATNYVMLELCQPLHAFDLDKLEGRKVIVRRARPGERITTLDGIERALSPDMLVIADATRPIAIAGVMGGMETEVSRFDREVSEGTTNILLESANFDPISIRKTARALRVASEASRRFERGQPPQNTIVAARRAAQLIRELADGEIAQGVLDVYPSPAPEREVTLTSRDIRRFLGIDFSLTEVQGRLEALEFQCRTQGDAIIVKVPPHRLDVTIPADLVEELARTVGYDRLPTTLPLGRLPRQGRNDDLYWEEKIRETMVGCGFHEVITYSLTSRQRMARLLPPEEWLSEIARQIGDLGGPTIESIADLPAILDYRLIQDGGKPVMVANPLSAAAECLRLTAMSSLLETMAENIRQQVIDLNLFEIGRIYMPVEGDLPEERRVLTAAINGLRSGRELGSHVETDFRDIKGVIEELMERLGLKNYSFLPVRHLTFRPGATAAVEVKPNPRAESALIGILGELDHRVREQFDLPPQPIYLAALDMQTLIEMATRRVYSTDLRPYRPLPRYPAVRQDIAVVVDEDTPAERVRGVILASGGELVQEATLFDTYRGDPVPPGKKSMAYSVTYQAQDHTLSAEEVGKVHQQIVEALHQELGAQLRA